MKPGQRFNKIVADAHRAIVHDVTGDHADAIDSIDAAIAELTTWRIEAEARLSLKRAGMAREALAKIPPHDRSGITMKINTKDTP